MKGSHKKALPELSAQDVQRELAFKFPDLTASNTGTGVRIRGTFPVLHEGKVLDRYQIEIDWSNSELEVPLMRETGGRIPWIADRHMSQSGFACLFVPEEWLLRPQEERTLIHYLEGPVRNYFLWQSLYERGESPPWKDHSHGVPGLLEAYGEMIGMKGEQAIKCCLEYLSKEGIKGHWLCYCGSGERLRNCHIERMRDLGRRIPPYIARLAVRRLDNPTIR